MRNTDTDECTTVFYIWKSFPPEDVPRRMTSDEINNI